MAKRNVNYTSVSITKSSLPIITQLKDYAAEKFKANMSSQMVCDFALELAWEHRDELQAYARKHIVDPRMANYLKLQAELVAAGLLSDPK